MNQNDGDSAIVKDFLVESYENLDRLDRELVGLEKDPEDRDALASVFRTIHTIKGTCGFLGFNKLEKVAHVGENLLSRLRDRQLTLNPEITTALLSMVDAVRQMLSQIEKTGEEGERDADRHHEHHEPPDRPAAPAGVGELMPHPFPVLRREPEPDGEQQPAHDARVARQSPHSASRAHRILTSARPPRALARG